MDCEKPQYARSFWLLSHLFAIFQVSPRYRIFRRFSGVDQGSVHERANMLFYPESSQPLHVAVAEAQKAKLSGWIPCLVRCSCTVCVGLCSTAVLTRISYQTARNTLVSAI